ncbi:MAG: TIGR02996 domain-containing protein [Kofleriaceae bacterium]
MLDRLRAAIADAAWGEALVAAHAWWRDSRAVELADLIDVLGARCAPPAPAEREVHAWWMLHATTYSAPAITTLAATASRRAWRSERMWADLLAWYPDNPVIDELVVPNAKHLEKHRFAMDQSNRIERLAMIAVWPDDPRIARVLATWFVEAPIAWAGPMRAYSLVFYERLAKQLIALGDARIDEALAQTVVEPRGQTPEIRARQAELARGVIARVANRPTALAEADRVQVAAWTAHLAVPVDSGEDAAALWDQIVRAPDDLGPRLVLADHLIERGDPRGELFLLQRDAAGSVRAKRLAHEHWTEWLGDLALVIGESYSEWRDGMLDAICVGRGRHATPDWAWQRAHGHHELAAVRSVRQHHAVQPERFLAFVRAMPRMPNTLAVSHATIEAMAASAPWPIAAIDHTYSRSSNRGSIALTFAALATAVPELAALTVRMSLADAPDVCAMVPQLPGRFPRLERVELVTRTWRWLGTRADCAIAPVVG